jgi:hypothetical protein
MSTTNTKVEYTEGERKAKKVFQNYFTTLLYSKPTIKTLDNGEVKKYDVGDRINIILKSTCKMIWEKLIERFFYKEIDTTDIKEQVKNNWDNYFRFYLKGGKSTLEFIKSISYIDKEYGETTMDFLPSSNHKSNISKAFYYDLINSTDDSDFDFCFVLNPTLMNDSNYIRHNRPIAKIMKNMTYEINGDIKSLMPDFLELINDVYNQKTILKRLIEDSIQYFTPKEQEVFKDFIYSCDSLKEPYFKFESDIGMFHSYIKALESKVTIPTDTFYLHRLVLPIKFSDKSIVFPTTDGKLFAECIDISFSKDIKVTEKLWKHTELNSMLRPLYYIDEDYIFSYPIAGLSYQLNDIVVILSENEPNKPQKRCKRLIEQLYFSCMEEKLPEVPSLIHIGKKVYELMKQEGDCKALNEIMTFKESINDIYIFELSKSIRNIEDFEVWCRSNSYYNINLSWESQCNINFISKEELRRRIINICRDEFDIDVKEEFKDFEKSYICILYKNLILISVILSILEGHRNIHMEKAFKNNWEIKGKLDYKDEIELIKSYGIKEPLKHHISRIIQKYVNRPYFGVYHTGQRIETLIGYIKRNFLSDEKDNFNLFLEIIYKFNIK